MIIWAWFLHDVGTRSKQGGCALPSSGGVCWCYRQQWGDTVSWALSWQLTSHTYTWQLTLLLWSLVMKKQDGMWGCNRSVSEAMIPVAGAVPLLFQQQIIQIVAGYVRWWEGHTQQKLRKKGKSANIHPDSLQRLLFQHKYSECKLMYARHDSMSPLALLRDHTCLWITELLDGKPHVLNSPCAQGCELVHKGRALQGAGEDSRSWWAMAGSTSLWTLWWETLSPNKSSFFSWYLHLVLMYP